MSEHYVYNYVQINLTNHTFIFSQSHLIFEKYPLVSFKTREGIASAIKLLILFISQNGF